MPNQKNIEQVAELAEKFGKAAAIYFTDYQGLDVANITELRSKFYEGSVEYRVAKNTLIKIAAEQNNLTGLDEILAGPTALAISYDEPTAPARIIKEFTKKREKPNVKGILFDGELLPGEEFKRLADLPSKPELLSMLIGLLQSPMTKLVRTLQAPLSNTVQVLQSLKDKKS
ncbi:MAG: 50S ribosomal protein L10 [Candidatus Neomarinimicrobiota bacterium]|nr:MAG: 50S ribosomal protein L10 [Candidatus Neomarinimicrobiota bacterium]